MEEPLSEYEQKILLEIAHDSIESHVTNNEPHITPREERRLNYKHGCFVTIKLNGQLRGCIGNFQSQLPLFKEVSEMAVAASSSDPRFHPLTIQELEDITVEISVLSPLVKIDDITEIVVGTHGIYLEKSHHRGVLLPQVAVEKRWDRDTFLDQTCIKAGLPSDTWRDGDTDIYIFSAQVFGE